MERWRKFLERSGVDMWTICERALTIAYKDEPESFPAKRDKLAQKLFAPEKLDLQACESDAPLLTSFHSPNTTQTERAHLSVTNTNTNSNSNSNDNNNNNHSADTLHHHHHRHYYSKTEEANSDDEDRFETPVGNYDEAEALTEEMEEDTLIRRDVVNLKGILESHEMHSEKEILESLERLNLMELSVEILKESEIGRSVNHLRKHPSKRVKSLAKKLVSDWKDLVDEWVKSVEDVAKAALTGMPASVSPDDAAEQEHGLPSPPIDRAALLGTQTSSMEMSQLLDFMDDDDPKMGAGTGNNHLRSHTAATSSGTLGATRVVRTERDLKPNNKEKELFLTTKAEANGFLNPAPAKPSNGYKMKAQIGGSGGLERTMASSTASTLAKANGAACTSKDEDYNERLQASKRKLQQNYQQAQIVKKQRTVQVMGLQELPKGPGAPTRLKSSSNKPITQNWSLAHR